MNFKEAMQELRSGNKVKRIAWKDQIDYLGYDFDNDVFQAYYLKISNFCCPLDLMSSDSWMIKGSNKQMLFENMIELIKSGQIGTHASWKNKYITMEGQRAIVLIENEPLSYHPFYEDFLAEDWVIVKDEE